MARPSRLFRLACLVLALASTISLGINGSLVLCQQPAAARIPEPNPDSSGVYHVANGVKPPKILHSVDPRFTDDARRYHVTGTSHLSLVVGVDGKPTDIVVVRSAGDFPGNPTRRAIAAGLDAKAIEAVTQYRFKAGTLEGNPVPVRISVEVNFQMF